MNWDWGFAIEIMPELLWAFRLTVLITILSFWLSVVGGLPLELLRRSRLRIVRSTTGAIIEFVRGTPLLIQLYFLYFVFNLSPLLTGILALSLHYSTYTSEIYKGGIESVPRGQWDAARVLGFSRAAMWRVVILRQVIPLVIPPVGNNAILMFKEVPLLSAISVVEVLQQARIIGSLTFRYLEPMTTVGGLYLAVGYASWIVIRLVERRLAYRRE